MYSVFNSARNEPPISATANELKAAKIAVPVNDWRLVVPQSQFDALLSLYNPATKSDIDAGELATMPPYDC